MRRPLPWLAAFQALGIVLAEHGWLRADAATYFGVLSDANALTSAADFTTAIEGLGLGSPWAFVGTYCFDTSCAGSPPPCEEAGIVYQQLATDTMTTSGDLCEVHTGDLAQDLMDVIVSLVRAL